MLEITVKHKMNTDIEDPNMKGEVLHLHLLLVIKIIIKILEELIDWTLMI